MELLIHSPGAYERNPTVSDWSGSLPFGGEFPVSMAQKGMTLKKGQAITAYLALSKPDRYKRIAGNIRYRKDDPKALIPLYFLDAR